MATLRLECFAAIVVVVCQLRAFTLQLTQQEPDILTLQDVLGSNLKPATGHRRGVISLSVLLVNSSLDLVDQSSASLSGPFVDSSLDLVDQASVSLSGPFVDSSLDLVDQESASGVGARSAPLDHGSGLFSSLETSSLGPSTTDRVPSWQAVSTRKCGTQPVIEAPDQPFKVVWNNPDNCERGHHLPLDKYGLVYNTNRRFIGNEIQTLYNSGPWPMIHGNQTLHGGLPQLFNMSDMTSTRHAFSSNYINNFTGLGVIDFEGWRYLFYTNYGVLTPYKVHSMELVKQQHPEYNKSMLEKTAMEEWQAAARNVMSAKLAAAQEIMPNGHWGYYGYPRNWQGGTRGTAHGNDQMWWLWEMATGLYPRMYMNYNPNQTTSMTNGVWNEVTEAVRIQSTFSPPNTEIYPYCNLQSGLNFFSRDYLDIILRLPADMGASGIVLWGSSSSYRNPLQCPLLQAHIRDVLGPYVKELTSFMTNCSSELCGGHGRCVHNGRDSLLDQKRSVELSNQCQKDGSRFHDYHCRCYAFWAGACCSDFQASKLAACQQTAAIGGQDHVTGNHGHVTPTKESVVLIGR